MDTSWWQSCQLLRFYDSLSFFEDCISFLGSILLFPFVGSSCALGWCSGVGDFWEKLAKSFHKNIFLSTWCLWCEIKSELWDIRKMWNPLAKKAKFLLVIVFTFVKKKKVFSYQGAQSCIQNSLKSFGKQDFQGTGNMNLSSLPRPCSSSLRLCKVSGASVLLQCGNLKSGRFEFAKNI